MSDILSAFDWGKVGIDVVSASVPEGMGWGLASYEAVHAATARQYGNAEIVTLDRDFALVPSPRLTIYTAADRVRACRRTRGGK